MDAVLFESMLIDEDFSELGDKGVVVTSLTNQTIVHNAKWDNFSEQVEVQSDTDLFKFKYLTWDYKALFEIVDIIKNADIYTLFIQYVTELDLEYPNVNTDFRIEGATPQTLRKCNLTFTDLMHILGEKVQLTQNIQSTFDITTASFIWALKINFSRLPDNLDYCVSEAGNIVQLNAEKSNPRIAGNRMINMQKPVEDYNNITDKKYTQFDTPYTLIIPIPYNDNDVLKVSAPNSSAKSFQFNISRRGFQATLEALLSDLVLSVEIVPWGKNAPFLQEIHPAGGRSVQSITWSTVRGQLIYAWDNDAASSIYPYVGNGTLIGVKPWDAPSGQASNFYPCFLCEHGIEWGAQNKGSEANIAGLGRVYSFIEISVPQSSQLYQYDLPVFINLCGNQIPLDTSDKLYLKQSDHGLRLYTNLNKNIYYELPNAVQYSKAAFSNFDAYQKSNISLQHLQEREQLKLQQQQQKDMQAINTAQSVFNNVSQSARTAAINPVAGAVDLVSGIINTGVDLYKQSKDRQNERANLALKQSQALAYARTSVSPSSYINGDIFISDIYKFTGQSINSNEIYSFSTLYLSEKDVLRIREYCVNNNIINQFDDFIPAQHVPQWGVFTPYTIFIKSKLGNARKDAYLFAEFSRQS